MGTHKVVASGVFFFPDYYRRSCMASDNVNEIILVALAKIVGSDQRWWGWFELFILEKC